MKTEPYEELAHVFQHRDGGLAWYMNDLAVYSMNKYPNVYATGQGWLFVPDAEVVLRRLCDSE